MTIEALHEWLLDGAPGAKNAPAIAQEIGGRLLQAGIPLERFGVFVTTLHPNVLGRAFIWAPGQPMRVLSMTKEIRDSAVFDKSPIAWCTTHRKEWRWRTGEPDCGYTIISDLIAQGVVDYVCLPMIFTNGEVHVLTFASKTGFSDEHVAGLRRITRPLARLTEIYAMRRTAENVLSTYVGQHSGARVMAGRIFKGDVETIRAAIWFSDLRAFTEMSMKKTAKEMIAILNDVFECQVPAIEKHGGEVLKFIGDGLLAIFPISDEKSAKTQCNAALDAAVKTFEALAALNAKNQTSLRIGLALHVGDVEYGNIGGACRLDFTAIGSAVNMAARLEGIAGKLGRPMVLSADFVKLAERTFENLGSFELKGISGPQPVFG
jgi:adenylate cyclase